MTRWTAPSDRDYDDAEPTRWPERACSRCHESFEDDGDEFVLHQLCPRCRVEDRLAVEHQHALTRI